MPASRIAVLVIAVFAGILALILLFVPFSQIHDSCGPPVIESFVGNFCKSAARQRAMGGAIAGSFFMLVLSAAIKAE